MDEATQQNSALVEQNAAASKALEHQSQGMAERVSFFRVEDTLADVAEPAPVATTPASAEKPTRHAMNGARRSVAA